MGAGLREPMWGFGNLARLLAWLAALLWSELSAAFARPRRAPDDRVPEWLLDDSGGFAAIVTGARTGIGRAVAARLARRGATVHVVCRTLAEARGVRDEILLERPGARLVPHGVDLARLRDIRAFSAALGDDGTERKAADGMRSPRPRPRPRLLVHCAGAMAARWRRCDAAWDDEDGGGEERDPEDASGWERVAAVNARAPAVLTEALLSANALARPARVVFVGSFTHRAAFPGDQDRWFDDAAAFSRENTPSSRRRRARRGGGLSSGGGGSSLSPRRRWRPPRDTTMSPAASYACSKAAVTAYALGRTAAGECDCVVWDPGLVDTDIAREWPWALRGLYVGVAKRLGLMVPPAAVADAAWAAAAAIDPGEVRRAGGCYAYGTRCVAMKPGGRASEPSATRRATAFLAAPSANGVGGSDPPGPPGARGPGMK